MVLLVLFLLLTPSPAFAGWVEGTRTGVRDDNPSRIVAVFINSYAVPDGPSPDTWHTVSVTSLGVPADVLALDVRGLLVITHGSTPALCAMTVSFRALGDTHPPGDYVLQATAPHNADGPRLPASVLVPIRHGAFEYYWTRTTSGEWPEHCSYGMSLFVEGYVR